MPKTKTVYTCQNCGTNSAKWVGKCPACGEWNTYVEEVLEKAPKSSWKAAEDKTSKKKATPIKQIVKNDQERAVTGDAEFNRVLGGGIIPGSLVLLGGEPGIGKSTLMLQLALGLTKKTLYVSGEESEQQIKMRAERIGISEEGCFVLAETSLSHIFNEVKEVQPDLLVIDSIQTLYSDQVESSTGSVSQVKQCTAELQRFAKETNTPVFLIGHITKDGMLAGPKVLEHMVDTVLQFEGDRHLTYRIIRTVKNRFGSTSELGIYEMAGNGLREVSNPSEILLSHRESNQSGVAIGATMEGNRPLLIETQTLVSPATYGTPQRSTTGFDGKRLSMLLAVLEKRGGLNLSNQDVFLNIAGGIKVEDPALDLAVACSLLSGFQDISIDSTKCFAAEIGLGGEIRGITKVENRISEAEKLGFKQIFISKYNLKGLDHNKYNIAIKPFTSLKDVYAELFG
ncbi:MAG: DNA repair protein RadA [Cyclobacteriaceae bacterium]